MRTRMLGISLLVVALAVVWFRLRGPTTFQQRAINPHLASTPAAARFTKSTAVVIQTGPERMTNAVRCMAFIIALANKLPEERASARMNMRSLAGATFFDDCLMSKMSGGFITISSNEMRSNFSNAVAQLYGTNIPENLVDGFDYSLKVCNKLHLSLPDHVKSLAYDVASTRTLTLINAAKTNHGITDNDQSGLTEMLIGLCSMQTVAADMYGPQNGADYSAGMAAEYHAFADSLESILVWRLTNIYGLDGQTAQTFARDVLRVPAGHFGVSAMQPPASIQ